MWIRPTARPAMSKKGVSFLLRKFAIAQVFPLEGLRLTQLFFQEINLDDLLAYLLMKLLYINRLNLRGLFAPAVGHYVRQLLEGQLLLFCHLVGVNLKQWCYLIDGLFAFDGFNSHPCLEVLSEMSMLCHNSDSFRHQLPIALYHNDHLICWSDFWGGL